MGSTLRVCVCVCVCMYVCMYMYVLLRDGTSETLSDPHGGVAPPDWSGPSPVGEAMTLESPVVALPLEENERVTSCSLSK